MYTDQETIYNSEKTVNLKHQIPWPAIIVGIIGIILSVYTLVGPVFENRKLFGFTLIILWTLLWFIILWKLWSLDKYVNTWWLLLLPVTIMILFFVLIILLNTES